MGIDQHIQLLIPLRGRKIGIKATPEGEEIMRLRQLTSINLRRIVFQYACCERSEVSISKQKT